MAGTHTSSKQIGGTVVSFKPRNDATESDGSDKGPCCVIEFPRREPCARGSIDLVERADGMILVDACVAIELMNRLREIVTAKGAFRQIEQLGPEFSGRASFEMLISGDGAEGVVAAATAAGAKVMVA